MKKNKFSILALAAPLVISVLSSTACGANKIQQEGPDTYKYDVTVDTRGTTITMWTGFGSDMTKELEAILEDFTAKTGIIVNHESKSGYPNLLKAINLASTSGSYPNIANGYPDHFASYVKSNILLRLDGFLENDAKRGNVDGAYTQNSARFGSDGIKLMDYDDFYDDYTVENETLEFDEKGNGYVLGVPFNKSTEVMVYNSSLFDWAAKQTEWKDKIYVPVTWADVKTVCASIYDLIGDNFMVGDTAGKILASDGNWYDSSATASENNRTIILNMSAVQKSDFRPFTYDSTANMFISLVRSYGGQYTEIDKSTSGKGYAVFNNAQTVEAMTMLKDLFDNNYLGIPAIWDELYCSTAFKAYKSVMNISSTAGLSNITSAAIPTKCAPVPCKDTNNKYVISQGTSLGLFDKGTEKERVASWKLMVYLSQQGNGAFAANTGYFPTCDYSYNSLEYQQYLDNDLKSNTDILRQESAKVNSDSYVNDGWVKFVDPGFRGSADIREAVDLIPGYLMTDTYGGVQETLDAVYKTISDYTK